MGDISHRTAETPRRPAQALAFERPWPCAPTQGSTRPGLTGPAAGASPPPRCSRQARPLRSRSHHPELPRLVPQRLGWPPRPGAGGMLMSTTALSSQTSDPCEGERPCEGPQSRGAGARRTRDGGCDQDVSPRRRGLREGGLEARRTSVIFPATCQAKPGVSRVNVPTLTCPGH